MSRHEPSAAAAAFRVHSIRQILRWCNRSAMARQMSLLLAPVKSPGCTRVFLLSEIQSATLMPGTRRPGANRSTTSPARSSSNAPAPSSAIVVVPSSHQTGLVQCARGTVRRPPAKTRPTRSNSSCAFCMVRRRKARERNRDTSSKPSSRNDATAWHGARLRWPCGPKTPHGEIDDIMNGHRVSQHVGRVRRSVHILVAVKDLHLLVTSLARLLHCLALLLPLARMPCSARTRSCSSPTGAAHHRQLLPVLHRRFPPLAVVPVTVMQLHLQAARAQLLV